MVAPAPATKLVTNRTPISPKRSATKLDDYELVKQQISLTSYIESRGIKVTSDGRIRKKCCCPFPDHTDPNPSFTIYLNTNSFNCFGCDKGGSIIDFVREMDNVTEKEAVERLQQHLLLPLPFPTSPVNTNSSRTKPAANPVTSAGSRAEPGKIRERGKQTPYDYDNFYQAVRIEYPDKITAKGKPAKKFLFRHRVRKGERGADQDGWVWNLDDIQRRLYHQNELEQLPLDVLVAIPEGEKCADILKALGIFATTNSGGAGKFPAELAPLFSGRSVYIFPDNSKKGREHAEQVKTYLVPFAALVVIVELPLTKEEEDVADYIAEGHTAEEIRLIMEESSARAATATAEEVGAEPELEPELIPGQKYLEELFLSVSQVKNRQPRPFLIKPYILKNTIAFIVGDQGTLKSFLALHWLLPLSERSSILYIAGEGGDGLNLRIIAWERHNGVTLSDDNFFPSKFALQLGNFEHLEKLRKIIEYKQPLIIVVDTLHTTTNNIKEIDNDEMKEFFKALNELKAICGSTIIVIHHAGKDGKIRGASCIEDDADTVIFLKWETAGHKRVEAECHKQKDKGKFATFYITPTVIPLPDIVDEDGEPQSSQIISIEAGVEKKQPVQPATNFQSLSSEGTQAAPVVEVEKLKKNAGRILDYLFQVQSQGQQGCSSSQITTALAKSLSPSTTLNLLSELRGENYLEQPGGKGGNYFLSEKGRSWVAPNLNSNNGK